jgi:hypothetical protein
MTLVNALLPSLPLSLRLPGRSLRLSRCSHHCNRVHQVDMSVSVLVRGRFQCQGAGQTLGSDEPTLVPQWRHPLRPVSVLMYDVRGALYTIFDCMMSSGSTVQTLAAQNSITS